MKKIDKYLNYRIQYKTIYICAMIALLLLLVPMLSISKYDIPSSDDFGHGVWTHPVYLETNSVLKTIQTALEWVGNCHKYISGTFTVQFLDALAPNVFSESIYWITPFIMLAALFVATTFFINVIFFEVFGAEKIYCRLITVFLLIIFTQFLPSPVEGYYWYVGSVTYTFYYAFFPVEIALLVIVYESQKVPIIKTVFSAVIIFILGGGNHITALMIGVIIICFDILSIIKKTNKILALLSITASWMSAFAVNLLAPGNAVRSQAVGGGAGFIKSFVFSFRDILLSIKDWTSLPFISVIMIMIPILFLASKKVQHGFKYPAAISFLSICFLAAMYYPPIFGMNSTGQGRLHNIVFFSYTILLVFNIFYWAGWLNKKIKLPWIEEWNKGVSLIFIMAMICCVCFGTLATVKTPVTSYSATVSILNGDAKNYHDTEVERLKILYDNNVLDAGLPRFEKKPPVLFFRDIEFTELGLDKAMAEFYNKNSVFIDDDYYGT